MTDQAAFEFRRAIMQVIEEIGVRYAVRNIERTEKAFAEYRKLTQPKEDHDRTDSQQRS